MTERINAFEKLRFESEFQALSPGGAISYVEVPNMQNNLTAVLRVTEKFNHTQKFSDIDEPFRREDGSLQSAA